MLACASEGGFRRAAAAPKGCCERVWWQGPPLPPDPLTTSLGRRRGSPEPSFRGAGKHGPCQAWLRIHRAKRAKVRRCRNETAKPDRHIASADTGKSETRMVFQRFLDDRNASVAPLLALSIVPIVGLIGASVDYGRANSARATLQSLVDSTALAVAQDAAKASPPLTQDQVNTKASDYFNALYTHSQTDSAHMPGGAAPPVVTTNYSPATGNNL